jgi:serine/threonine protein kinase
MVSSSLLQQLQTTLGETYRLEHELGGGGMSRVFVAHDQALDRKVVVKVLLPELAAGVSVSRFRREIQLAARLQHPHIVPLLSAGESQGLPYFVMPYVSGESLRARVAREGELPVSDTIRILRDVVSALVYAHSSGVMHRDIKPDNVLLSGGVAVVTDFGVAKALSISSESHEAVGLTSMGVALGTPAYMAPEQATGDPQADHRADIYSLGAMAYEMLTGRPPFIGRSPQAVLAAHVVETPDPIERLRPAVPGALAGLVTACLAKRPADRPQSAREVINLLDALATPSSGMAPTTATTVPALVAAAPRRRRRSVVALGAAGLVLVLLAGTLWLRLAPPRPASPAVIGPSTTETSGEITPPTPPPTEETPDPARSAAPKPARKRQAAPAPVAPAPVARDSASEPAESAPAPNSKPGAAPPPAVTSPVAAPVPASVPAPPESVARPAQPAPVTPTPRPPADPGPEIRRVVTDYASAIESRDVGNIRRVYPGMTAVQERGWNQFFQLVREVDAQLDVTQLDTSGATANARITGNYTYLNSSTGRTEHQPVTFQATLHKTESGWRISEVR